MTKIPITETEIETIVVQECKLKGYSQKTIDNYLHHIKKFASSGKSPREYPQICSEIIDFWHSKILDFC